MQYLVRYTNTLPVIGFKSSLCYIILFKSFLIPNLFNKNESSIRKKARQVYPKCQQSVYRVRRKFQATFHFNNIAEKITDWKKKTSVFVSDLNKNLENAEDRDQLRDELNACKNTEDRL